MDAKWSLHSAAPHASAGAVPEVKTRGLTVMIAALLIAVGFAVLLVITLPQTLDAAGASPTVREPVVATVAEPTFHERYPVQPRVDWVDTLDEARLAEWRMRASD